MSVYQGSRYTTTPVFVRGGSTAILETRSRFKFDLTDATYYTVIEGDTVSGIAYKQYGNAQLYWAILDANYLQSELDISPGTVLAIPPFSEVSKYV